MSRAERSARLLLILTLPLTSAQTMPQALISGQVVDAITNRPIAGATVTVTPAGTTRLTAETDASGNFTVAHTGAVRAARVAATARGFVTGNLGQLSAADYIAAGNQIDVPAGARVQVGTVRLWPTGAIRGRVTNDRGEPVVGAVVDAFVRIATALGPRWHREKATSVKTDDRGMYGIEGLRIEDYLVSVRTDAPLASGRGRASSVTWHPAARTASSAQPVRVAGLQDATADIVVSSAAPSLSLRGTLSGSDRSLEGVTVRLLPVGADGTTAAVDEVTTVTTASGAFIFPAVAPGMYRLSACQLPDSAGAFTVRGDFRRIAIPTGQPIVPAAPREPTLFADANVTMENVPVVTTLTLQPAGRLSGRVVFEGDGPPPTPEELRGMALLVRPADGVTAPCDMNLFPQAAIDADGRFQTAGIAPGDYAIALHSGARVAGARAWRPVALDVGGRDVLGDAFRVTASDVPGVVLTMTDRVTELRGNVRLPPDVRAFGIRVVIFPQDQERRRRLVAMPAPQWLGQAVVDGTGAFTAAVLPGDYLVAAVTSMPDEWRDPDYLASLAARATSVRVVAGQPAAVTVTQIVR